MQAHYKPMKYLLILAFLVAILAVGTSSLAVAAYPDDPDTTAPVVTNVVPADGSTIFTNGGSTIYYQSGNTTPLVIKADYSDETGGSGVDVASVMVHLDVSNMLMNCPVQTATHVECIATAADLTPGTHPVDIYVDDVAGNATMHRTWVTVVVDNAAPTYSNLSPADGSTIYTSQLNSISTNDLSALRIDYDLTDPAPSSGWSPMTHINESVPPGIAGAMISNTSCVKSPSATNPTHYSCQMNRAKLLHLGDNTLSILLKDKVGNTSSDYSNSSTLKHYTVVDDVDPLVSNIAADQTTITATYADPAPTGALSTNLTSGINAGTAMVHVDGAMIMMGCTATATGISCPTPSGLSAGTHSIEVMVSDDAGNLGMGTGTLCVSGKPGVSVSIRSSYWASYADFTARELSVTLRFRNSGTDTAFATAMTGSTNTNGVSLSTAMPLAVGDLTGGANTEVTARYHIPVGVGNFKASITGSASDACGTSYTYPV
ncbi:MAG: hypothetical protein ACYC4D_05275 [Thermoleophilia bacterium]